MIRIETNNIQLRPSDCCLPDGVLAPWNITAFLIDPHEVLKALEEQDRKSVV